VQIGTAGVVGAGVMGVGVAQNLAQSGFDVLLVDISEEILASAQEQIRQNVRFSSLFYKKSEIPSTDDVLKRIVSSVHYELLERAEFIIENTTEKWEIKREVYQKLDAICTPDCIFAANTSVLPITRLASLTKRPAQVIGTHFMNPVPVKKTVEVIRGEHTSEETIATTVGVLGKMGKECVIVQDSPGFVSNRVLMLTINEAIFLVQEKIASAEEVDKIFRECFGHKMGPLETADLIGLDTILFSIEALYESFNDSKYRPSPLLKKMVQAGFHGRKSSQGFYSYKTN